MSSLCALSIVTAVLCGIWSYLAGIAGLIGLGRALQDAPPTLPVENMAWAGWKRPWLRIWQASYVEWRSSHLVRSIRYSGILESGAGSLHSWCASLQNTSGLTSVREHSWDVLRHSQRMELECASGIAGNRGIFRICLWIWRKLAVSGSDWEKKDVIHMWEKMYCRRRKR